jgi:hypothetical protein
VNWWTSAVARQVVSFWRSKQGQALEQEAQLPSEHEGEKNAPPDRVGVDFDADRILGQTLYAEIATAVLDGMDNASHAAIGRRAVWDDQTAKVVADEFGTTPMNVDQIKPRFKRLFREECERRGVTSP